MPPTISLSLIARDRARELSRLLESVCEHVDEIVVVDAGGSSDGTREVARRIGAKLIDFLPEQHPESFYDDTEERFSKYNLPGPFTGSKGLADFSAPRNLSFSHCTSDVILWLDTDDTVQNPERFRWLAEQMEDKGLESIFLQYEYERDAAGHCLVRQVRERMVWRKDFESGKVRWNYPIHEHLHGLKRGGLFEDVVIVHDSTILGENVVDAIGLRIQSPQRDRIRFRNLKNLLVEKERLEAANEELPWRLAFYLGTEMRSVNPELAIRYLQDYIRRTGWDEERAQARLYIAQIREMQSKFEEAWDYFAGAATDFPSNPMPWFGLSRVALVRGEWNKVVEYSERGFAQVGDDVARKPSLVLSPFEWQYRAHLPYSRALIEIGRFEDAIKSCRTGLAIEPQCRFLREHLIMAEERLATKQEKAA